MQALHKSAESDEAKGLADASANLMQSLDNLLDSLENSEPNQPTPAVNAAQPEVQAEPASLGRPAKLSHDGRTPAGAAGQQQYAPRSPGYIGKPSLSHAVCMSGDFV